MLTYSTTKEVEPAILREMFRTAFGLYPVLEWHENWTLETDDFGEDYDTPVVLRDFHLLIDTEQLHTISEFEYGYVSHLLIKVVEAKLRKPEIKHLDMGASKKYSFSDTEDWWNSITFKGDISMRERFDVAVTIR